MVEAVEGYGYFRAQVASETSERWNTTVLGLVWEVQQRRSHGDVEFNKSTRHGVTT